MFSVCKRCETQKDLDRRILIVYGICFKHLFSVLDMALLFFMPCVAARTVQSTISVQ